MFSSDATLDLFLRGSLLAFFAILWLIILIRFNGLRSFSKMTNFDFAMTIAIGSLLAGASQSTDWRAFAQTLIAMSSLFIIQYIAARLRKSSEVVESLIQNQPVVLMRDGVIFDEALASTRVARSDLIAKLREANVLNPSEVRAVILETTGDVSVLHGNQCSDLLLEGTRRIDS